MTRLLQVLLVEDNPRDAELMEHELRREGFAPVSRRVDNAAAFVAALAEPPDLILCDMSLPGFDGLQALAMLRERGLEIPLIVVSGVLSDGEALNAVRHGAVDYLLKDRLARLGPAARQALTDAELRRQRRQTEDRLRTYVEQSPVGLLQVAPDGSICDCNPSAERILGCPRETLLAGSFEDMQRASQPRLEFVSGPRGEHLFTCHGNEIWIDVHLVQLDDGYWLVYLQDVTLRRQTDAELQRGHELFRQVTENLGDVLWITDRDLLHPIFLSRAYEKVWGRDREHPGEWLEAIHPEDRTLLATALEELQKEKSWEGTFRIVHPDGSVHWIQDSAFGILDEHGEVYRWAGFARDVTRQRALEQQFLQAQKMEAIGTLAGGIAHDFNNLLTVIGGHASMLSEPGQIDWHQHLEQIDEAVQRAAALTRQLLLFSRRHPHRLEPLNLNQVVAGMARMLLRILGEDVELVTDLSPDLPHISGDERLLEQALMNLAVNARDAMPSGGRLSLETGVVPSGVRLVVRDTGQGIAPQAMPHVFEPFFTTKEVGKGTGLGLATVYGIVQTHRGTVEVESAAGAGTTFALTFPRVAPPAPRPQGQREAPPQDGTETVLVVEDEPELLRLVTRVLSRGGYQVLTASSGPGALQVWDSCQGEIDLLLSDVIMPGGLDGPTLARRLTGERPELKVLLVSGYPDRVLEGESLPYPLLSKPYSPDGLRRAVRERLDAPA